MVGRSSVRELAVSINGVDSREHWGKEVLIVRVVLRGLLVFLLLVLLLLVLRPWHPLLASLLLPFLSLLYILLETVVYCVLWVWLTAALAIALLLLFFALVLVLLPRHPSRLVSIQRSSIRGLRCVTVPSFVYDVGDQVLECGRRCLISGK